MIRDRSDEPRLSAADADRLLAGWGERPPAHVVANYGSLVRGRRDRRSFRARWGGDRR